MAERLTEEDGMTAVGIILGVAARHMITGVDYSESEAVRLVWPEACSADAMQVGALLVFALVGIFGVGIDAEADAGLSDDDRRKAEQLRAAERVQAAAGHLMPAV